MKQVLMKFLWVRSVSVGAIAVVGLACCRGIGSETFQPANESTSVIARQVQRPNVVIFVTDDQRASSLAGMPQTRRLFESGGRIFTNGFVTTPLCCPSRASILTGDYAHNHGVENNLQAERIDQTSTLEAALHTHGYQTGLFGKFFNMWPLERDPRFWDRFAYFHGDECYFRCDWNVQGNVRRVKRYSTTFIRDQALEFLHSSTRKPWLLYVAFSAPHAPAIPQTRFERRRVAPLHVNPAMRERNLSDKVKWVRDATHSGGYSRFFARQARTLLSVDRAIGSVMQAVRSESQGRSTLAFFLSDNGVMTGEHHLSAKGWPYTASVHVPFYVRWPGHIRAGSVSPKLVANIDIAPTILDAIGDGRRAERMDGRPLLSGPRRKVLLLEYHFYRVFDQVPQWASLRSKRFQYIEYKHNSTTEKEYFDLRRDPYELHNLLSSHDVSRSRVAHLHRELLRQTSCRGENCFVTAGSTT